MAVSYSIVDDSNVDTWRPALCGFARNLDTSQRCNASAVAAQRWELTYPSEQMVNEFVSRNALIVVAEEDSEIIGYMVCTDDRDRKYGGCYCRWIGLKFMAPPMRMAEVYAGMGDIAVAEFGWLWGRVSNGAVKSLMLAHVDGCELGIPGDSDIVTYKKP